MYLRPKIGNVSKHHLSALRRAISSELAKWDEHPLTPSEWADVLDEHESYRGVDAYDVAQQVIGWRQRRRALKGDAQPHVDSSAELARFMWARSLLHVAAADDEPAVHTFRADVLDGQLLKLDDIAGWVERQRQVDGPATTYITVPIPYGVQYGERVTIDVVASDCPGKIETLEYGTADGRWVHHAPVAQGGALDRLRHLSTHLARTYNWQPGQASVYVLTGLTPVVQMFRVGHSMGSRQQVTIEADPDVPTELVASAFKRLRAGMLGPRARRPFARGIELVVHAAERPGTDTRALWHQWNREHPDVAYKTVAAFSQALRDARSRVQGRGWPAAPTKL